MRDPRIMAVQDILVALTPSIVFGDPTIRRMIDAVERAAWVRVEDAPPAWKDGRPLLGGWWGAANDEWRQVITSWKSPSIVGVVWVRELPLGKDGGSAGAGLSGTPSVEHLWE